MKNFVLTPFYIAFIYVITASIWIVGSGYLVLISTHNFNIGSQIEVLKGLLFVLTTGVLLYILLHKWHSKITETHNSLHATLDAIPDLLFEVDQHGKYYDYHSPRTDLLFAPKEAFIGKTIEEILPAEAARICIEAIREANARIVSHGKQIELEIDGNKKWFELSVSTKSMPDTTSKHFIILSRDITDRIEAFLALEAATKKLQELNNTLSSRVEEETAKRLEQERVLLQQSKLAIMGELVSSIAHHWRQPLNTLGINIQDAYMAYENGEIDKAYMSDFKTDSMSIIQSMSKTIDNFRHFFKPSTEKSNFLVEDSLKDSLAIIERELVDNNIELSYSTNGKHQVNGYKNELSQTIVIVISNAKEALIKNKVENPHIDISIATSQHDTVILNIQDNAGGILPEIIDRIFEPYYTTKHQLSGIGMGLFIARETIERQMKGKLSVKNDNVGACFTIEIPMK